MSIAVETTADLSPPPETAGATPLFVMSGITKRFGAFTALDAIDLTFRAGEVQCLLGENGAGKSTLCNLIFGVHQPDEGTMTLRGEAHRPSGPRAALAAGVAMVHQHFSLVNTMTVVDNLLLGRERGVLRRREYATRLRALGAQYELPLDPFALVEDLSVGERQRVEIVKCLMAEPKLLILDEPTAVLLPDEIAALLRVCRRLASEGTAIVMVTHKLAELKQVADEVTVLRHGRIVARSDRPAAEIDRLVSAMIQRELGSLGAAAAVLGVDEGPKPTNVLPLPLLPRSDERPDAVQIDGLTVVDAAGTKRLGSFTTVLKPGEIVGIAGVEGNGQSELGLALAGMTTTTEGRWFVGKTELTNRSPKEITAAGVGIVPEDRHRIGCVLGMSVAENIYLNQTRRFTRFGLLNRGAMRRSAGEAMERFDVRAPGPDVTFASLSGGNQQKAVLARELMSPGLAFMVAAQPTRGLDVGAVEAVYRLIREACADGVAVLLISSELDEIIAVADRILVMYRGRIVGERPGDPEHRDAIGAMMAGQIA
ncbi:MAG: ABC transporter ATP-binding protein [Bauldia sp.]|nr:ABC transporter ATP-binding protein [Bauldia sp.]